MDADRQALREKLEGMLAERLQRGQALEKHLRGADGRNEADFADRVAYTEMDEVLTQLDDQARDEVQQIHAALQRVEDGSFDTCATCGEPIGTKRLLAMPFATQCVGCAS
ncbi:MAG: TraR/DksA family transcriptional regulator [Alphaproteobacteria bacterium]|nr:TraR/DksA family transcriptional regulator [Alphaproteobacteria bacterium]